MKRGLPTRVYLRHNAYFLVTLERKWIRLCSAKDGLPAVYRALANLAEAEANSDRMPAVITRWLDEQKRAEDWSDKHTENMERVGRVISNRFADFKPDEVTAFVCKQYLKDLKNQPRTHNVHRSVIRQVLSFAAGEGLRDGHNPVDDIAQRKTPGRHREATDAEIKAIRAAALERPRNGKALAQMIDLALLTGQRIGDLIKLRWQDVTEAGIVVTQSKTGEKLLIEWSPKLKAAIAACERGDRIGHVLQKEAGGAYQYSGIRSAWVRACERAGVEDLHIHDLRGRAGVDALLAGGISAAQGLLGHTVEATTRHYVEGKYAKTVKPAA